MPHRRRPLPTVGELDGIDPALHGAYRLCRDLNARHGKTYFLATRLLPVDKRAGVHALYGFARMVDDIIDVDFDGSLVDESSEDKTPLAPADRRAAERVDSLEDRVRSALSGAVLGESPSEQVLTALVDTVDRYAIPHEYFYAFFRSMRMDIPGTDFFRSRYRTMAELREYMYGSAAVIGLEMLPILGASSENAEGPAAALGEAFQLTNFIRDMGEDLDRDRIYLPTDELAAFGVDEALLRHCRDSGRTDQRLSRALAHLIAHTRAVYRLAEPGIEMLDPRVQSSMQTAFLLYGGILREVEDGGYRVLQERARVPGWRRLSVAGPRLVATGWTRLRSPSPVRA